MTYQQFVRLSGAESPPWEKMVVFNKKGVFPTSFGKPFRVEILAVVFCTDGSCEININMMSRKLVRGSILMYAKGTMIELVDASPDVHLHFILFDPSMVEKVILDKKSVMAIIKYFTENSSGTLVLDEQEIAVIEKIYELAQSVTETGRESIMRDILSLLVNTLGEMYNRRINNDPKSISRTEEYFGRFLKEVSEHYQKERSVKYYADALHITPKYLSTIIKEVSGKSAVSWINDFVIQQAKIYLRFSGKSIQEIAYQLNFSTQSFFGKYFKRYTGVSPSDYRKDQ